tara:strand:- start:1016 stop:1258 length:243 start_codon:yes stop_codon:yes gene_type:complete
MTIFELIFVYGLISAVIIAGIYYFTIYKTVEKKWSGTKEDLQKMSKKELDEFAYKWYDLKLDARSKKAKMVDAIWSEMNK